ncbi:MAG: hypothetical protein LC749_12595 [Actinobacteria bacterium]|nr:hypothetical protein [Actinomycetota bacterium]
MFDPMLAQPSPPPTGPGWAFEFKWDGMRALTHITNGTVRAFSRTGRDITASYPELATLAQTIAPEDQPVVLDGEIVALDMTGRPDLGLLQRRMLSPAPNTRLLARIPVQLYVFDVLHVRGEPITDHPYAQRRRILDELGINSPGVGVPTSYTDVTGQELLDVARQHGLEGVVSKRLASVYRCGARSWDWRKTVVGTKWDCPV